MRPATLSNMTKPRETLMLLVAKKLTKVTRRKTKEWVVVVSVSSAPSSESLSSS